uniref:C-type lectin domain-containing protein n=1 Tax=Nothobranchius furzeri TaxID=105023 RepID=A0A8C6LVF0_NOTFU
MRSMLSGALMLLIVSISSGVVLKRYQYFEFNRNWSDAQSLCRKYSGDLATIYNQPDMNSLWLRWYIVWINLHRDSNTGQKWVWTDGTVYNGYNWAPNEPDPSEDCAVISAMNNKYYGLSCEGYAFSFCENYALDYYYFIPKSMTWSEAQQHCQNNYGNLAKFNNNNMGGIFPYQHFPVWIGLHRDGGSWSWSSGVSKYNSWDPAEPSSNGDCVSIGSLTKNMATQNCGAHFPFICMWENLLLVKENKSWEEALEFCRALTSTVNSNLRFDLLSVQPGDQQQYVMAKIMEANSDEVWTGLHFLAGEWLWVNGEDVLYRDLPVCPALQQHCGAISKSISDSLEARDCLERKNFLCYVF